MGGSNGLMGLNGKTGEVLRWGFGLLLAAIVAYFSAQLGIEQRMTAVEVKQELNFDETQRALSRIEIDIREIKRAVTDRQ